MSRTPRNSTAGAVADLLGELTDRERAVLALMAEGLTNRAIAARMTVGVRTVESHVQAVFAKLGLRPEDDVEHRRVAAVLVYLRATGREP